MCCFFPRSCRTGCHESSPLRHHRLLTLTRFSIDFLTNVKLFQRESKSFRWVPLKNSRWLMICDTQMMCEAEHTHQEPGEGFRHLDDDEERLRVILRVLQDVTCKRAKV